MNAPTLHVEHDVARADGAPWRLLLVEDDQLHALLIDCYLRRDLPDGSTIDQVGSLEAVCERMADVRYDAVLVDLSLENGQGRAIFSRIAEQDATAPRIALCDSEEAQRLPQELRKSACDVIDRRQLEGHTLFQAVARAVASRARSLAASQETNVADRQSPPSEARYPIVRTAVILPIEGDGSPGQEVAGTTLDVSVRGIGLLAERPPKRLPDVAMVGVEDAGGEFRYAAVQWVRRTDDAAGLRLGGRFLTRASDPFHASNLTPRFHPQHYRYAPTLPDAMLQQWSVRGILKSENIDRIKTCPRCSALPTLRDGCPECGGPHTRTTQLIHHFACAYVGPLSEFDHGGLTCPKCRARDLVVGADFEHLDGPCQCTECAWSDTDPALICECLQCGLRFPEHESHEKDVVQFYVDRLDPLALIEDAR